MTFATGPTTKADHTMSRGEIDVKQWEDGWTIRVLGPVDLATPDGVESFGGRLPQTLIATLVIAAGRIVSIDHLIEVMWGDDPPASALNTLQSYVSRLRHLLGADSIRLANHGYVLDVDVKNVDALRFEQLIRSAAGEDCPPEQSRSLCHEALQMWRGVPFGDLADIDPFRLEAMRLDELRMLAMETQLEAELELDHPELVIGALESAVRETPYREHLWFMLIDALTREGRRREALEACGELRRLLAEIGLDGGPNLATLEDRIAQGSDA
jgi:DNA-binding SARP family transcriptional activator